MTISSEGTWACPKDGTDMQHIGRRPGAWRCPTCNAVFLDIETMRSRRGGPSSPVRSIVGSIALSLVATLVARRVLRRHPG